MDNKHYIKNQIEKGIALLKSSSLIEAIKIFEDLIKKDNNNFQPYYLLGTSYLQLRKLDMAELNLRNSLKLKKDFIPAMHNLGITLSIKNEYLKAEEQFLKILKFDPKNLDTLTELGRNYEPSKNLIDAKKYYQKVLDLDPKNRAVNGLLGRMLLNSGYHKLGLNYLKKSTGLIRFNEKNFEIIK